MTPPDTTRRLRIAFVYDKPGWAWHHRARNVARWLDPAEFNVSLITREEIDAHREADFVVSFGPYGLPPLAVVHPQRRLIGTATPYDVNAMDLLLDEGYALAGFANSLWQQKHSRHPENVYYLPNGVDEELFLPAPEPPSDFAACWVGNAKADNDKGLELIQKATRRAGVPLHIAEGGSGKVLSHEELRDQVYHRSAFYICMSVFEGTPNPGLEALACGLPVISTPVGNLQDIIRDEHNGLLVERSVEALVEAIARLQELDYDRLRKNARDSILDGWRWRQQADRYAEMFRDLAAKRPATLASYPPAELGRHQNRLLEFEHFHYHTRHLEKRRLETEWKNRKEPICHHRPTGKLEHAGTAPAAIEPPGNPDLRRVLVVANNPSSPSAPNIWLGRVLPLLRKDEFDPEVLFFRYNEDTGFIGEDLEKLGIQCHYRRFRTTEENVRDLCAVAAERKPAIVVNNVNVAAYFAGPWLRAAGIKTIGVLRSDDAFHHDLLDEFFRGEPKWQVDAGVGVSEFLAQAITAAGVPALACPSGAPLPDFAVEQPRDRFSLAYAGRFVDEQKQISEVVGSLITLLRSDVRFEATLYGTGPLLEAMRQRVAEADLNERLRLPGIVRPDKIQRNLAQHHAFVLLSDYEGLSTALLEGMAVGLVPIVKVMRSGLDEVITDGENGLLVADRDAAFHQAARALADDPDRWQTLSTAARTTVADRFSSQNCAQKWGQFLRELKAPDSIASIDIPALEEIQLPPVRPDPSGMAREDRRWVAQASESTAAVLPDTANDHHPFTNPLLHANFVDSYWTRHSILIALKRHLPLFHGTFLDVGCGVMP